MVWMRYVCGRLESRYRYSNNVVYNPFPWAGNPTDKQREDIETCAKKVLEAREAYPTETLANLYDPLTMPSLLRKAHSALDRAVDKSYGKRAAFKSEPSGWGFYLSSTAATIKPYLTRKSPDATRAKDDDMAGCWALEPNNPSPATRKSSFCNLKYRHASNAMSKDMRSLFVMF